MPLKDYTTKKEPEVTIMDISSLLKDFGVQGILSEYDDTGNVVSMSFKMLIDGHSLGFKLPTDWRPVLKAFQEDRKTPRSNCNEEQARRTAWRLVYHWIDAQLALVRIDMVKMQTIFLPYIIITENGQTLSEKFEESPGFLLGSPEGNN